MAGFLSTLLYNPFGMKGRRYLAKGKFKIISEKKVLRGILQDNDEIDENLTDSDDDIVSDNKSESDK